MKTNAIDVVYVTKGFLEAMYRKPNWKELWAAGSEPDGEDSFLQALADHVPLLEKAYSEIKDWEGMWLYEVAEPFGAWLAEQFAEHKEFPDDRTCIVFIKKLAGV